MSGGHDVHHVSRLTTVTATERAREGGDGRAVDMISFSCGFCPRSPCAWRSRLRVHDQGGTQSSEGIFSIRSTISKCLLPVLACRVSQSMYRWLSKPRDGRCSLDSRCKVRIVTGHVRHSCRHHVHLGNRLSLEFYCTVHVERVYEKT